MSRRCQISQKSPLNGHKVSHANKKSNKVTYVNLQKKRLFDPGTQKWVTVRVSTRMLRTIAKNGLAQTLRSHGMTVADLA